MKKTITKTFELNAPLQEVFAFATDPRNLPKYWVGVVEVKDLKRQPNGGENFKFVSNLFGVPEENTAEWIEFVRNERTVTKTDTVSTQGSSTLMTVRYERLDGGKTRLSSNIEWELPDAVFGKLDKTFIWKMLDDAMELTGERFKFLMEAGIAAPIGR